MATAALPPLQVAVPPDEQRMLIHGVSWKHYIMLREALDTPGLRMTYLRGSLELMSPSKTHEVGKKLIARLLEHYAFRHRLPLNGYGSTTFRREAKECGAEPDECYAWGRTLDEGEYPDLVIEVLVTSPLLDKREVYAGFGVPELWLYRNGTIEVYRLDGEAYRPAERSVLLPELDLALVARLATSTDQLAALQEFDTAISAR